MSPHTVNLSQSGMETDTSDGCAWNSSLALRRICREGGEGVMEVRGVRGVMEVSEIGEKGREVREEEMDVRDRREGEGGGDGGERDRDGARGKGVK